MREFSGKGIGLSICRDVIKFVRGEIEIAEPVLDKGTTLVVRYPIGVINS